MRHSDMFLVVKVGALLSKNGRATSYEMLN